MARARTPIQQQAVIDVPKEYEDSPVGWKRAYSRAYERGCSEKAAILYADAHGDEFEDNAPKPDLSPQEMMEEIARLKVKAGE